MKPELDTAHFPQWQDFPWPDFPESKGGKPTLALQPVCALLERANDLPLDLEEKWILACLDQAAQEMNALSTGNIRTLPCFRNVPTLGPGQVFGVTVPEGSRALYEIAASVASSGVTKIAFIHCNRALGDWIDTLARELRIDDDVQAFNLNLGKMGIPSEEKLTLPASETIQAATPALISVLEEMLAFPIITAFTPPHH